MARRLASSYGVTRVVPITGLDRIGIPVSVSIRPGGEVICVHAGKGLEAVDAEVGAYMEAIEVTAAERVKLINPPAEMTTAEVESLCNEQGIGLSDFGYLSTDRTPAKIRVYEASELLGQKGVVLPAELVLMEANGPIDLFVSCTNGLASGNSVEEAALHALCELLERETSSFNLIRDRSVLLNLDHELPDDIGGMVDKVRAAGLDIFVRYTEGFAGLPYFSATILERHDDAPVAIAQGFGCHPLRSVALVRAISEAAQCRLVLIHGGRDDIPARARPVPKGERVYAAHARLRSFFGRANGARPFGEIGDAPLSWGSIKECLASIKEALNADGFSVFWYPVDVREDLAVIRVIVPGLEFFEPGGRSGPRLRRYARQHGREAILERGSAAP
jgi:ribosomal protein S12 methylthiotransferase accessory factor